MVFGTKERTRPFPDRAASLHPATIGLYLAPDTYEAIIWFTARLRRYWRKDRPSIGFNVATQCQCFGAYRMGCPVSHDLFPPFAHDKRDPSEDTRPEGTLAGALETPLINPFLQLARLKAVTRS
jgi:hypothetical protein